jgi:hypothetical protein
MAFLLIADLLSEWMDVCRIAVSFFLDTIHDLYLLLSEFGVSSNRFF